jgi:selenide,water dikinase
VSPARDLVLVGGGHAHVQVLRRFAMQPPPGARVTVVVDVPVAVYSGMVPGFVAGQYAAHELEIDVVPLARRAKARVVLARAIGIDPAAGRIAITGRSPIRYDVASFDVGSGVIGVDLPGVKEHALPTRPIGPFVRNVDAAVERITRGSERRPRIVIVGGGAGGIELAFTLDHRVRQLGIEPRVTLLNNLPRILPASGASLVARAERAASRRGIEIRGNVTVIGAREGAALLADGSEVECDLLVWVTGAAPHPLFRGSGLGSDDRGFVLVRPTLQVIGHDNLFATGDCATLAEHPETAKAGVYAVREGPYLADNLYAQLAGTALRRYTPQHDFLSLLNLGDGTALGGKWGRSFEGRWVMELKDRIDRRFMRKFQVLAPGGEPENEFPVMSDGMQMVCGGCAAKVGQSVLDRALERVVADADGRGVGAGKSVPADPTVVLGLDNADDAAAVRTPRGDILTSTVDVFSAFTDDPWLVGKVAAVNAVSDLLATGVPPRYALALVAVPETSAGDEAEEILYQTLSGARAAFDELGVTLLGGHTTTASKLMVGFSVDGFADDERRLMRLDRLRAGQVLVLTKALGTGVVFHADMRALARGPWVEAAIRSATRSNAGAFAVLRDAGVDAATDVTGFGLVGHLGEMLRASGTSARVKLAELPILPGAVELLGRGLRSTFHAENERARRGIAVADGAAADPRLGLLFDPQTSGGLLFGIEAERAPAAIEALREIGPAAVIGEVTERRADGALIEVV